MFDLGNERHAAIFALQGRRKIARRWQLAKSDGWIGARAATSSTLRATMRSRIVLVVRTPEVMLKPLAYKQLRPLV